MAVFFHKSGDALQNGPKSPEVLASFVRKFVAKTIQKAQSDHTVSKSSLCLLSSFPKSSPLRSIFLFGAVCCHDDDDDDDNDGLSTIQQQVDNLHWRAMAQKLRHPPAFLSLSLTPLPTVCPELERKSVLEQRRRRRRSDAVTEPRVKTGCLNRLFLHLPSHDPFHRETVFVSSFGQFRLPFRLLYKGLCLRL